NPFVIRNEKFIRVGAKTDSLIIISGKGSCFWRKRHNAHTHKEREHTCHEPSFHFLLLGLLIHRLANKAVADFSAKPFGGSFTGKLTGPTPIGVQFNRKMIFAASRFLIGFEVVNALKDAYDVS